jgi:hypothetical protein
MRLYAMRPSRRTAWQPAPLHVKAIRWIWRLVVRQFIHELTHALGKR